MFTKGSRRLMRYNYKVLERIIMGKNPQQILGRIHKFYKVPKEKTVPPMELKNMQTYPIVSVKEK